MPEDRHHVGGAALRGERELYPGYHDQKRYLNGPQLDIDAILPTRGQNEKYDNARPIASEDGEFLRRNQQKIVLAREMEQDPGVLIVGHRRAS